MRVADLIFDTLSKNNINQYFCVTGRGSLFLNDAIKRKKDINCVFTHHEQSASFAAISYYQASGKIPCCIISTGCASTNTITGLLSAWQDGLPCIFISGQNYLNETTNYSNLNIRTFGQQEANIIPIVRSITKYAVMIQNPKNIQKEIKKALFLAQQFPRGPVWIDIPLDIQNAHVNFKPAKFDIQSKRVKNKKIDISYVLKNINQSKRPVIIIGSGIKTSGAEGLFKRLINKYKIPVVYTHTAVDTYGSSNKFSIGSLGSQGCSRAGAFTVQNSDLILILGSRMNSLTTGPDQKKFGRNAKIIAVDINKEEFKKKNIKIDKLILSDLKLFIYDLLQKALNKNFTEWLNTTLKWKRLFIKFNPKIKFKNKICLYKFSDTLSKLMKNKSVFICDSGFVDVIMPTNVSFKNNQICIHPASQGVMGFAIPAILGVKTNIINNRDIIAVVGDGSLMMNLQELQTIKYQRTNVKIFVINNNMYGIIRRRQNHLFRGRTVGTDQTNGVPNINIKKIANCFGFKYFKVSSLKNFNENIKKIINLKGQIICEIKGLNNQDYIEIGYAANTEGRIIRRPLEDQRPFLDRDIFKREMIIKPIDL
jgi:acetolactate synthase-1/2/3 large subunit